MEDQARNSVLSDRDKLHRMIASISGYQQREEAEMTDSDENLDEFESGEGNTDTDAEDPRMKYSSNISATNNQFSICFHSIINYLYGFGTL